MSTEVSYVVTSEKNNVLTINNDPNVIVTDNHNTIISSIEQQPTVIVTGSIIGNTGDLNKLNDVDVSALSNGSILIYKTDTKKWTSTKNLDQQFVDGGQF